ncbi:hypothetical protein Pyn_35771 [Prunus yedoensis var. nudiflora]|uniref:Uncharacterized protein n=1 Tax=Prunus yedoensis var. nudiflora TaxID=2094558 RepID=A0A314YSU1_PRUYE|nr:hypothetical protein Pyn_06935 [Prunus yedoensis var. nudiflora]PQQ11592.1 hypothetical protein Pyn_35771 [Prunus yedoensis var. nudiflora]
MKGVYNMRPLKLLSKAQKRWQKLKKDGEWGGANADQSVPKPSDVEDFVDNEDMFAVSEEDEQHLRKTPQSDEESTGH